MLVPERLIHAIEESQWLDQWSAKVRSRVEPLVGTGIRRDVLSGTWLGHPAHPAGALAPLSFWMAAVTLDVVGGRGARPLSKRLTGLGVLAAAPVALAGAADWLDIDGAEERVGTVHAALNSVATVLFGASWLQRRRGHHVRGAALGFTALTVTAGAAYLGGHLTYRRGVGVDTTAFQSGPDDWTQIDRADSEPGQTVMHATTGTLDLAVIEDETADRVFVLESRCTHRGGPLHEGELVDGCIVCPWHGSRFDVGTGAVEQGPASAPQPVYETRRDGEQLSIRRTEHGGLRRNPVGAHDPDR